MTESIDFRQVLLEIEDDVREKRASGELPIDVERELDAVFARFSPTGAIEGNFSQLIERAEQQAFIDLIASNASAKPGVPYIKRVIQKTVRWYLRYVVDQFTGFAHTIAKAVKQLGERVDRIESLTPHDAILHAYRLQRCDEAIDAWQQHVVDVLSEVRGRVVHARCGEGALVRSLKAANVDAYGIDAAPEAISVANTGLLDLRVTDERAHLRELPSGALHAIILSGCTETLARGAQKELIELSAAALARGGTLVLVSATPAAWLQRHDPIERDLSPGSPLHAETWEFLLKEYGFSEVKTTFSDTTSDELSTESSMTPVLRANMERLNRLLFAPSSYVVVALKR